MGTIRKLDGLLSSACKGSKDRAARSLHIVALYCTDDGLLPETLERVALQISSRGLVFRVLESTNSTSGGLALASSAGEEMNEPAIVILDLDVGLEETIYR